MTLNRIGHNVVFVVNFDVGRTDVVIVFVKRAQKIHVILNDPVHHTTVRRLDKPVFIDARKRRKRCNKTDVRTFRRFDRADAAIVRRMHVADFKTRALARQTARTKRRKTTFVRQFAQRVGLIHKLRQLARTKIFAHHRHHRLGIDQIMRTHHIARLIHRHAFLDRTFHTG